MLSEKQVKLDLFHVLYIGLNFLFFITNRMYAICSSYYTVHLDSNSEYCVRNW